MSIEHIAERQYGLITTEQLLSLGVTQSQVQYRARTGKLVREARGLFRVPGVPFTTERRLLAAQLATRSGVLSHRSAAAIWCIKGVQAVRPEVTIPAGTTTIHDVIAYRRHLRPEDVTTKGPFRLTTPSRTLRDLAPVLTLDQLEIAIDDSVTRSITTLSDLAVRVRRGQRGVDGIVAMRSIVEDRLENGTPASYLETTALRALRRAGLPRPISQFEIRDGNGTFVARPDLVYPDLQLAIELDGDRYHAGKAQRRADLDRQNRLVLAGWTFLRFTLKEVKNGGMVRSLRTYLQISQTTTQRTKKRAPKGPLP
jgi:very-short-patch-repair endonuclease